MKHLSIVLSGLLFLFWITPSHAFTAFCDAEGEEPPITFGGAAHVGIYSNIDLDCVMAGKGDKPFINFTLETFGPGLQNFIATGVIIECPLVSQKRLSKVLKKKGKWSVGGLGASVGAVLIGARAGVAINHRGAVCTILGLSVLDAVASGGYIQLTTEDEDFLETIAVKQER